ncbi:hypothetical protein B0H15DRAFT_831136 [Mycena belliarum]|uniref:DUF6533 domain-containing protein n=1 Tax=Mycena belliarum TaxID=1033014 RepID=A0AAD6UDI5_9AGAR|nr:hypothetical protein B0H15DRAFT_831136 [Mycena belliae]
MDSANGNIALIVSGVQTVKYVHVVNVTILLFDYSLTLSREVSLMWSSQWSLSKILFFLSRYSPIFDVPILLYYSTVSDLSNERCSQLQAASSYIGGTVFGVAVAEAILVLRTYALSGRCRGVLFSFAALWASALLTSTVLLQLFLQSTTYGPPPSPDIPGCSLATGNVVYVGLCFILVLLNDTVIMFYTLWIGLWSFRNSRNPLILALYRDGIMYYLFLCIVSAINVAMLLRSPTPVAQTFNTFLRVLHAVLSTRILLHARDTVEDIESVTPQAGVILSFQIADPCNKLRVVPSRSL